MLCKSPLYNPQNRQPIIFAGSNSGLSEGCVCGFVAGNEEGFGSVGLAHAASDPKVPSSASVPVTPSPRPAHLFFGPNFFEALAPRRAGSRIAIRRLGVVTPGGCVQKPCALFF
jgi:hypothetical protein